MATWRRLIEGQWARNLVARFGVPRARREQEALDISKLYTSIMIWKHHSSLSPADLARLLIQANSMSTSDKRAAVAEGIEEQLIGVASLLDSALAEAGDTRVASISMAAAYQQLTGQQGSSRQARHGLASTSGAAQQLPMQQVSKLLKQRLGYTLRVDTSHIPYPEAGLGLFVDGEVPVGSVVAVLPGVTYTSTQLTRMPNYPKVSLNNDYLSSRYDSLIVDSKPWGRGQDGSPGVPWPVPTSHAAEPLGCLEGRHPLALGHFVNHPAPGQQPNVLEAAFDLSLRPGRHEGWMRAYLPVAPLLEPCNREEAALALLASAGSGKPASLEARASLREVLGSSASLGRVSGLVLIATRAIKDGEEVLQNYRLSPHVPRPSWYTSCGDPGEEERRWAKLRFARLLQ